MAHVIDIILWIFFPLALFYVVVDVGRDICKRMKQKRNCSRHDNGIDTYLDKR
jgi:hypothetical protein